MDWEPHAASLAARVTHPSSRWRTPLARTPRHALVPRWWERDRTGGWVLRDGPADEARWLEAAYSDKTLVTSVGGLHADLANEGDRPTALPTSSSTLPSLNIQMFRHAQLGDTDTVLHIGTGPGVADCMLAHRLGDKQVISVDVDPYLVEAARTRLHDLGLHPAVLTADGTGSTLPGDVDAVVATVGVRPIPSGWLAALRPGGRLVTTVAGTSLIITAAKNEDGSATGRIAWDRAGFMSARPHAARPASLLTAALDQRGEDVTTGPYPVVHVSEAWDLASMLELIAPGIEHDYTETDEGQRIALMAHEDGSWARASGRGDEGTEVHQGGPRRLWNILDDIRTYWLTHGELPVRGARVFIKPDGGTYLARGDWRVRL
ncbi:MULTISPECIES: methyltransferase domain-containing protein [Streptomyces]|uniref:Protein-L-isoaspartate O-methyltransferase n=1 Tax=Streptomyces luteosporeus TaxID=173856 RepID=A0ABP6FYP0_9ACTN